MDLCSHWECWQTFDGNVMEVAGNFCIVQELFEYNINSLHGAMAKTSDCRSRGR